MMKYMTILGGLGVIIFMLTLTVGAFSLSTFLGFLVLGIDLIFIGWA